MRVSKVLAAALVIGGLAVASVAWSQEPSTKPIRLLILGPESKAYSQEQLSMLAIQLRKLAERYGQLQVLPESATDVGPLRKQAGCSAPTPECLSEIGKAVSAEMIMHIEIQKLPGRFLVVLTQIDVSAKKVIMQSRQPTGTTRAALQEEIQKGWIEVFGATFRSRLKVTSNVSGAQVMLDGRAVGKTPLLLNQEFGKGTHKIEVTLDGYQPVQRQIQINASSVIVVELVLQPEILASAAVKPGETQKSDVAAGKTAISREGVIDGLPPPIAPLETKEKSTAEALSPKKVESAPVKNEAPFAQQQGVSEKNVQQSARSAKAKPFYKQWWFWTAVGVVVVGGTIGAIVGATSGKEEGIPSGKGRVLIEF
jgi:hypothetical protein